MGTKIMCDPPMGRRYGFPKEMPDDIEDLIEWLISEGYPKKEVDKLGKRFYCNFYEVDEKGNKL